MEVWQRNGMKVRVLTAPSPPGADTSVIFGTVCCRHIAQTHQFPGLQPDVLEPVGEIGVGFQCFGGLVPGDPQIGGVENDHRHAVVDAGDLDSVDRVDDMTGREQGTAGRAGGVGEREADRCRCPGYTVDGDVTGVLDLAARGAGRWRWRCCRS